MPVTNGSGQLQDGNGHLGCGTGTFTGTPTRTAEFSASDTPCAVAFGTNNNQLNTERLYTIRVDYNISNNQKLFFRFNNDTGVQATGTSPVNPALQRHQRAAAVSGEHQPHLGDHSLFGE